MSHKWISRLQVCTAISFLLLVHAGDVLMMVMAFTLFVSVAVGGAHNLLFAGASFSAIIYLLYAAGSSLTRWRTIGAFLAIFVLFAVYIYSMFSLTRLNIAVVTTYAIFAVVSLTTATLLVRELMRKPTSHHGIA